MSEISLVKIIMFDIECYITVTFRALALMVEVNLFFWSACACEMTQVQWACWIAFVVGAQIVRGYLLLQAKSSLDHQVFRKRLQVVSLCIIMLLGVYFGLARFLSAMVDQCPAETQAPTMKVMFLVNIAFCLVCAGILLTGNTEAQATPPNLGATVKLPVTGDSGKLLARLTSKTFTQETQSRQTDQVGECIICLSGPYRPGDIATELHCHHVFHSSCIAGWILHGGQGCPMRCKADPIVLNEVEAEAVGAPISVQEFDV